MVQLQSMKCRSFLSMLMATPFVSWITKSPETIESTPAIKSQYILRYPPGTTDGVDNFEIAQKIMKSWLNGGSITLPNVTPSIGESSCHQAGWKMIEYGPFSGFDYDWSSGQHELKPGNQWKITDATGKEYERVTKLNSRTGMIVQECMDRSGPIFVQTLAPLPIKIQQVIL